MLRKWGYDAVMAHDGNEAWQSWAPTILRGSRCWIG